MSHPDRITNQDIENLTAEVQSLRDEVRVLRESIDDLRDSLQWALGNLVPPACDPGWHSASQNASQPDREWQEDEAEHPW